MICEKVNDMKPLENELPSKFADRLGIHYTNTVTKTHKKNNGQFFTPIDIANLMSSMCDFKASEIRNT